MHSVSQIFIYPIKGLGGISLTSAKAKIEGFENDRRWMLVDKDGKFLSQRENAMMALFKTECIEEGINVTYENESVVIPFNTNEHEVKHVSVWGSKMKAQEVSPLFSTWFSDNMHMNCTLVSMTEISKRYKRLFVPPFKTYVSFADGYPYLILGEESMVHLNEKLDSPLKIDRFRANIIVTSQQPHEEDDWSEYKIGTSKMKVIKPCARCNVTTINQQTGEIGKEPLKTLATYRRKANKIYFGANAIILEEGEISVGDSVLF